jgi:hypothetical protein
MDKNQFRAPVGEPVTEQEKDAAEKLTPSAPFQVTNRKARRAAAAQARSAEATHHNTLARKADRLL